MICNWISESFKHHAVREATYWVRDICRWMSESFKHHEVCDATFWVRDTWRWIALQISWYLDEWWVRDRYRWMSESSRHPKYLWCDILSSWYVDGSWSHPKKSRCSWCEILSSWNRDGSLYKEHGIWKTYSARDVCRWISESSKQVTNFVMRHISRLSAMKFGHSALKKKEKSANNNDNFAWKNGESRNGCRVKIGGVCVEGIITWRHKLEHLCETEGQERMYAFTGDKTEFGNANAWYRQPRHHWDFWWAVLDMKDSLCFPWQSEYWVRAMEMDRSTNNMVFGWQIELVIYVDGSASHLNITKVREATYWVLDIGMGWLRLVGSL